MTLYGALYAWATARLGKPSLALWASLLGQTACVIGMSAAQYHGLEGTLLGLVSLQLGLVAPRQLHDAMGHHLAGLSLNLEMLAQRQGMSPPLETARSLTRRALDDVESLVDTLGRERDFDFPGALAALAGDIPRPRVHVDAADLAIPDPRRTHALWRCCQEIVTNAVKHSEAENLWIAIRMSDGRVELTARDDGSGSSRLGRGQGLEGMRQRLQEIGGALQLETSRGAGFLVRVTLPSGPA